MKKNLYHLYYVPVSKILSGAEIERKIVKTNLFKDIQMSEPTNSPRLEALFHTQCC